MRRVTPSATAKQEQIQPRQEHCKYTWSRDCFYLFIYFITAVALTRAWTMHEQTPGQSRQGARARHSGSGAQHLPAHSIALRSSTKQETPDWQRAICEEKAPTVTPSARIPPEGCGLRGPDNAPRNMDKWRGAKKELGCR